MNKDKLVQKLRDLIPIEWIIERYPGPIGLEPKGKNYTGDCPFCCTMKSLLVNPSKNIFHCFNCGKGGDSITFLMCDSNTDGSYKKAKILFIKWFTDWLYEKYVDDGDSPKYQTEEMSNAFRFTRKRIKEIEAKALSRLKSPEHIKKMEEITV